MKPPPSDPAWDDPRITAYALGELDDAQRQRLEQQMADDPRLAAAVREATQIIARVSDAFDREPSFSLSSERREAIMQTQSPEPRTQRTNRPLRWLSLALAASLIFLLGLGSGLWLPQRVAPARFVAWKGLAPADQQSTPPQVGHPSAIHPSADAPKESAEGRHQSISASASTSAPAPTAAPAPGDSGGYGGHGGMGGGYGGGGAQLYSGGYGGAIAADELQVEFNVADPSAASGALSPNRRLSGTALFEREARYRDVTTSLSLVPAVKGLDLEADLGHGPGMAGDRFDLITDNAFRSVEDHPLSTFSIDVDTASYAKVRSYLLDQNLLPRPDAVRIEELVNYFQYDYDPPADDAEHPFASRVEITACPWNPENRLARVALKGREIERQARPAGNFVFLLDVSGSMDQPNKLPLVKRGMQLLLQQLNDRDRIAIVVYAGAAGLVLDSTPGDRRSEVEAALERLSAGGSTNGGDGIQLAYSVARDHFIADGVNRVILCTDGDFNVGTTGTDSLVRMVEDESKGGIYLSVLGFGMGNHNDSMLEQISGRGNGNYAFIDTEAEAQKVLVEQASGTLVTIAKDVKIQVEFNPAQVAAYRLIGYENRILAKEDFNDDTKDAGEIGAGHTVTALYELVPAGKQAQPAIPDVEPLRYQLPSRPTELAASDEVLTLRLRYKQPDGDTSTMVQFPASDDGAGFAAASKDFQFAAAVASFGMQLRQSPYKGQWTYAAIEETAQSAIGDDPHGLRAEFIRLVQKAASLSGATAE